MDQVHDSLLAARASGEPDSAAIAGMESRIGALEDSARALVVPNEFDEILSRNGAQGLNAATTNESTIYYVGLPANRAELWFVLEADRMRNPHYTHLLKSCKNQTVILNNNAPNSALSVDYQVKQSVTANC